MFLGVNVVWIFLRKPSQFGFIDALGTRIQQGNHQARDLIVLNYGVYNLPDFRKYSNLRINYGMFSRGTNYMV